MFFGAGDKASKWSAFGADQQQLGATRQEEEGAIFLGNVLDGKVSDFARGIVVQCTCAWLCILVFAPKLQGGSAYRTLYRQETPAGSHAFSRSGQLLEGYRGEVLTCAVSGEHIQLYTYRKMYASSSACFLRFLVASPSLKFPLKGQGKVKSIGNRLVVGSVTESLRQIAPRGLEDGLSTFPP